MERLLIVNADDFGLSKGQNYGIIEACRNGIVTSTTALTPRDLRPITRLAWRAISVESS